MICSRPPPPSLPWTPANLGSHRHKTHTNTNIHTYTHTHIHIHYIAVVALYGIMRSFSVKGYEVKWYCSFRSASRRRVAKEFSLVGASEACLQLDDHVGSFFPWVASAWGSWALACVGTWSKSPVVHSTTCFISPVIHASDLWWKAQISLSSRVSADMVLTFQL